MNCCNGNNNHQDNGHKGKHKSHMSHMWMMILCCGAPLILLLLLPLLGKILPGSNGFLSKIIPFICPIMMLAMLPMMFKKDRGNSENSPCENKQLKNNV